VSTVADAAVAGAAVAGPTEHLAELHRLEHVARESARTLARRRLAVEQARAAVPDRGRFLTSRLYPSPVPGSS